MKDTILEPKIFACSQSIELAKKNCRSLWYRNGIVEKNRF